MSTHYETLVEIANHGCTAIKSAMHSCGRCSSCVAAEAIRIGVGSGSVEFLQREIVRLRELGQRLNPNESGFCYNSELVHFGMTSIERLADKEPKCVHDCEDDLAHTVYRIKRMRRAAGLPEQGDPPTYAEYCTGCGTQRTRGEDGVDCSTRPYTSCHGSYRAPETQKDSNE